MGSCRAIGRESTTRPPSAQAAPHGGSGTGRENERTTRTSSRGLSGVDSRSAHRFAQNPQPGRPTSHGHPNRQICAQPMAHLTTLTAIHTRRFAHCRLHNVVTLRYRCPVRRGWCVAPKPPRFVRASCGRSGGWSRAQPYRLDAGSEEEPGLTPSACGVPRGDQTPLAELACCGNLSIWSAAA